MIGIDRFNQEKHPLESISFFFSICLERALVGSAEVTSLQLHQASAAASS